MSLKTSIHQIADLGNRIEAPVPPSCDSSLIPRKNCVELPAFRVEAILADSVQDVSAPFAGEWCSGSTPDSGSGCRGFESSLPSHFNVSNSSHLQPNPSSQTRMDFVTTPSSTLGSNAPDLDPGQESRGCWHLLWELAPPLLEEATVAHISVGRTSAQHRGPTIAPHSPRCVLAASSQSGPWSDVLAPFQTSWHNEPSSCRR